MVQSEPAIGIVLLAAGGSTRMGSPKQLLPFDGQSLLRRAATTAVESGLSPVIVVLGANQELLAPQLDSLSVTIVSNPEWARGIGTSIRIGLEALLLASPQATGVILTLHDQPLTDSDLLRDLVAACQQTGKPIVASAYESVLGAPALFSQQYFAKLRHLDDEHGAKQLIRSAAGDVFAHSFPGGACDIDTLENYRALVSRPNEIENRGYRSSAES